MKKNGACLLGLTVILAFLAACGKAGNPGGAGGAGAVGADRVTEPYKPSRTFDWKQEWNCAMKKGEGELLYIEPFVMGEEVHREGTYNYCCVSDGAVIYELFADDGTGKLLLRTYDTMERNFTNHEMSLPTLEGYEGMSYYVRGLEVAGDDELVLILDVLKDGARQAYLAVHMTQEGRLLEVADFTTLLQNWGCWNTDEQYLQIQIAYDACGGYYTCTPDINRQDLFMVGKDGTILGNLGEGKSDVPGCCFSAFQTSEHNRVYLWQTFDGRESELGAYVVGEGRKSLVKDNKEITDARCMALAEDGYFYYTLEDKKLYCLDLITGMKQCCADLQAEGLQSAKFCIDKLGYPVAYDVQDGKTGRIRIYHTSTVPIERKLREVKIKDCQAEGNPYFAEVGIVAAGASRYNALSNELRFQVEQPKYLRGQNAWQEKETFRTKAMEELATGNPADIYVVSRDDMLMLYEKGALADLSDVLTDDIKESLLPGSQEAGVIDGKQIGLIPNAPATMAVVLDDFWEKDTWTLEEMLDCLEQHPQYAYAINGLGGDMGRNMLSEYFLHDIGDTPFVDLEKGRCDFDTPLFRRLLELLKTYQYAHMWENDEEKYQKTAGFVLPCYGYSNFTLQMSQIPPGYHVVGLPSESGKGNYWDVNACVVVYKDAKNREEIDDFLRSLFCEELQLEAEAPVRGDIYEKNISYDKELDEWSYHGREIWHRVYCKPDGDFWLEDYMTCMKRCAFPKTDAQDLREIIREEADGYFMGLKSLDETIDIIQNRVQLYLNERK